MNSNTDGTAVNDADDNRDVDFAFLLGEGLTPAQAYLVLRGEEFITQTEAADRWELLQRERGGKA